MNNNLGLENLTEEELLSLYDKINKHLEYLSNSILVVEDEVIDGGEDKDE